MRKILVLLAIALITNAIAAAQDENKVQKFEVYGGYMLIRVEPGGALHAFNSNGGVGAFQYNLGKHLGFVAELGGTSKGKVNVGQSQGTVDQGLFTYLFGPRYYFSKTRRISPFAEFLIGGTRNSRHFTIPNTELPGGVVTPPPPGITLTVTNTETKFTTSQNAFTMSIGGGVDIKVAKHFAIRPIQIDYLPTHFSALNVSDITVVKTSSSWQNNLRYSAGLVFRFSGFRPKKK